MSAPQQTNGATLVDAIVPLSAEHQSSVREIFGGKASQSFIDWKYFDQDFNQGRLRGVCALNDSRVVGFIGVIPVTLRRGSEQVGDSWLCDWKIEDPVGLKGLGGAIAKEALAQARRLIAYGGSEVAKRRWPRHAAKCDFEAGITLKKFLRLDGLLKQLERRRARLPFPSGIRGMRTFLPPRIHLEVSDGVAGDLPLDFQLRDEWAPYYSIAELRWQLERCPFLTSATVWASGSPAKALVWHPTGQREMCKAAVFAPQGSADERKAIAAASAYAFEIGAHTLTFNCSRLDRGRLQSLKSAGFLRGKQRIPIHFLNVDPTAAPDSLAGLSCLDADMGSRFT